MVSPGAKLRIAILGGGRAAQRRARRAKKRGLRVRTYRSVRDGGRGETTRLCESLRRGGTDVVVIVQQFNGHSATEAVRKLCEHLAVPWRMVKRASELPDTLAEWEDGEGPDAGSSGDAGGRCDDVSE